jgi:hypothetical protein
MKNQLNLLKEDLKLLKQNEIQNMNNLESTNQTRKFYISIGKIVAFEAIITKINCLINASNEVL